MVDDSTEMENGDGAKRVQLLRGTGTFGVCWRGTLAAAQMRWGRCVIGQHGLAAVE